MHFFGRLCMVSLWITSLICLGIWILRVCTSHPEGELIKSPADVPLMYETVLHAQQLRKTRLRDFCKTNCKHIHAVMQEDAEQALSRLVTNTKLELLYCDAPALGLDRWKQLLQTLQDTDEVTISTPVVSNLSLLAAVAQKGGRASNFTQMGSILKSYTKVLFVRDPFERLVFAYMQHYADKIPFREFILNVISQGSRKPAGRWQPLVSLCHACLINYDYIIKHQFQGRELPRLMHRMGIPNGSWMTKISARPFQGTYRWLSEKLLKELSVEEREKLVHVFRWDFNAFHFSSSLI